MKIFAQTLILLLLLTHHQSCFASDDNTPPTIVIMGSSIAQGAGATDYAHAWAGLLTAYIHSLDPKIVVVNLGVAGYTTRKLMPTGSGTGEDPNVNVTRAILFHPKLGVLSLTSNDTPAGIPFEETKTNFLMITGTAKSNSVPIWVTSTVPCNATTGGFGIAGQQLQMDVGNWLMGTFSDHAINIYNNLANPDGSPIAAFNTGDGVHPNNTGHQTIYEAIKASGLIEELFGRITLTAPTYNGGQFSFSITNVPYACVTEASTDQVNWIPIATNTPPFTFTETNCSQSQLRFYRAHRAL